MEQWNFFLKDISRIAGKKKYRFLIVFFTRAFWGLFLYRLERSGFLVFGKFYSILRLPFIPLFVLIQSFSNIDIHYKANIKGGILILHPSLGLVISGLATLGKNCIFVGGNVVGFTQKFNQNKFIIGDNCNMGANSVILGPIVLGNNITIGALACVIKNCEIDNSVLVGVPAK
jgi:serine O-acetyltransferase